MPANSLLIETFTEYAIGMCFLALKVFTRVHSFGIRGLQLDDLFAVLAMIFWTLVSVIILYLQKYGSNIADAKTVDSFPDSMVPNLILGSKLAFTNWIWYLSYIWSLKGVLLCLYHKMTIDGRAGTHRHRTVYLASAFCAITYLACLLAHVCVCTPITKNWQVRPYPGEKCTLRKDLYVVIAILNVASDLLVMIIPIPILLKLQIPPARKIILIILFCSGIFVMISTVLRAYYSIKSINTLTIALGWADRECFVAAIIASLPGIKPLFRNTSWLGSGARSGKQGSGGSYGSSLHLLVFHKF
ncbi:hypothetical protein P168DRAFT_279388 [Aspergillus campestris IBT 28561]|uniref:Rhodopsin domain-containing protein n=1 Tax=Aspergillus campestris (strain IBT 28561) TaxID=1392248 RepID=A0A2I1DC01_ASPC2|nr:uncharacterized protein P168DRAFT_279388 [Aspergillus campestris IBT 28561]PKY07415.1 hypothetical protein P168DRAFT_279388 [Aspergillus campestris IBT 28561]